MHLALHPTCVCSAAASWPCSHVSGNHLFLMHIRTYQLLSTPCQFRSVLLLCYLSICLCALCPLAILFVCTFTFLPLLLVACVSTHSVFMVSPRRLLYYTVTPTCLCVLCACCEFVTLTLTRIPATLCDMPAHSLRFLAW